VLELAREFWSFLRARKKFWLLPIIVVLRLFGTVVVAPGASTVAPFISMLV
jgi:hypothetical protein